MNDADRFSRNLDAYYRSLGRQPPQQSQQPAHQQSQQPPIRPARPGHHPQRASYHHPAQRRPPSPPRLAAHPLDSARMRHDLISAAQLAMGTFLEMRHVGPFHPRELAEWLIPIDRLPLTPGTIHALTHDGDNLLLYLAALHVRFNVEEAGYSWTLAISYCWRYTPPLPGERDEERGDPHTQEWFRMERMDGDAPEVWRFHDHLTWLGNEAPIILHTLAAGKFYG